MSTLNCPQCKELGEGISAHHRSPRKCGFAEDGLFQTGNYCCGLLEDLRDYADLTDYLSIIKDTKDYHHVTFEVGKRSVNLMWYKNRGAVTKFAFDTGERVDVETATLLHNQLVATYGPLSTLKAAYVPDVDEIQKTIEKVARNSRFGM